MLGPDTPVLVLEDGAADGLDQALEALEGIGAQVLRLSSGAGAGHPLTDPLTALPGLYRACEAASRARGLSPDAPERLKKETVTL